MYSQKPRYSIRRQLRFTVRVCCNKSTLQKQTRIRPKKLTSHVSQHHVTFSIPRNGIRTIRTMVSTTTTNNNNDNNTGTQSNHQQLDDGDSDWMQSIQTESEEMSHQKVKGTVENVFHESSSTGSLSVGTNASSEEGYSPDCSSDQQLDSESDNDSDGMQSSQTKSEEHSVPKVTTSTDETVLLESSSTTGSFCVGKNASSGEGYRTDCSAFSDQASDQSFSCARSGQKQKSTLKVNWNLLHLKYTSTEIESISRTWGSSVGAMANTTSSASKAKTVSNTAKRSLNSSLKATKNHEATLSTSTAVAPGLSSSNKQNRRHHCSNHHRRRSQPRLYARDRADVSPSDLNTLVG
jgi:hypothetical protein